MKIIADVAAGVAIGLVAALILIQLGVVPAPVYPPTWFDRQHMGEAP